MSDAELGSQGVRAITPYLIVRDAARAITFLETAFGATEVSRIDADHGKIGHAELRVGGGTVFLADEFPDFENIVGRDVHASCHSRARRRNRDQICQGAGSVRARLAAHRE